MQTLVTRIRSKLLAGVVVTVPAVATFLVLRFLFRSLDALLGPWIAELIGREIPGLGVIATVALVLVVGVVATHYVGARAIFIAERLFARVPFVHRIYSADQPIDWLGLPS